jgi:hypothetical protein
MVRGRRLACGISVSAGGFPPLALAPGVRAAAVTRPAPALLRTHQMKESLMPYQTSDHVRECIDRCQRCQEVCLETITHCLAMGGRHAEASHLRMLMACAELCDTSARLMLLGSEHHVDACAACTKACLACAKHCDAFIDDEVMQHCADECFRCAESCRQMAVAHA